MYEKISSIARGMIPRLSLVRLYSKPSIVQVFPVPVCPQAKIVALQPSRAEQTDSLAVFLQTSSWEDSSSQTWSKVNSWRLKLRVSSIYPSSWFWLSFSRLQYSNSWMLLPSSSTCTVEMNTSPSNSRSRGGLTLTTTFTLSPLLNLLPFIQISIITVTTQTHQTHPHQNIDYGYF